MIASFSERRVENVKWNIKRIEEDCTCSGIVSVLSEEGVVRSRSGVFLFEEEVKILEDGGVY